MIKALLFDYDGVLTIEKEPSLIWNELEQILKNQVKEGVGIIYWEILDDLGKKGTVFCPDQVKREIDKVDDTLKDWLNNKPYFIQNLAGVFYG